MIKLNLGCGHVKKPGFIGVDLAGNWSGIEPDVESDLRDLPFPDAHADEVHAYHVIEHFHRWEINDLLLEWSRVLKPGGLMVLELPCLDKILRNFFKSMSEKKPLDLRRTLWGLYGDPSYQSEAMVHKWAWSKDELETLLKGLGFVDVTHFEPKEHVPDRDMRFECRKPG